MRLGLYVRKSVSKCLGERIPSGRYLREKGEQKVLVPCSLERIDRQRGFKETQKYFLLRLLTGNSNREARRNLMDPKRICNTDRYQDEAEVPERRFFIPTDLHISSKCVSIDFGLTRFG